MQAETVTVREPNVREHEPWASYLEPHMPTQGETVREVNMTVRELTARQREPKVKEREPQETVCEKNVTIREPTAIEREQRSMEREQGETVHEVDAIVREPTATEREPYGREPYAIEREQEETVREVEATVSDRSVPISEMKICGAVLLTFGIMVALVGIYLIIAFPHLPWIGIVVGLVGLAIIGLGVVMFLRIRKRRWEVIQERQIVQGGGPVVTGSVPVGQADLSSYPLGPQSYAPVPASAPPQLPPSYKDAVQI